MLNLPVIAAASVVVPPLYNSDELPALAVENYVAFPLISGITLRWDGWQFTDKDGTAFTAPNWFIANNDAPALLGVMVSTKDDDLSTIQRILRQPNAQQAWKRLRFIADDLPDSDADFNARWQQIKQIVGSADSPHLQMANEPQRFSSAQALNAALDSLYAAGKDGFILKKTDAPYTTKNNGLLLALSYDVGEAVVLAHRPGKGELAGMLGSLAVEDSGGGQFILGVGFSHQLRQNPPAIGSYLKYKYKGYTATGKPKSPVFLQTIKKIKEPPLIGGFLSITNTTYIFLGIIALLAVADALSYRRRHLDFKSAIVSTGLLGTFVGIWWGLYNFDARDIAASVPALLDGLKFAFVTSIVGIATATALSIIQTVLQKKQ